MKPSRRQSPADRDLIAIRRAFMARMRDAGSPVREIADFFRVSRWHAYRELAAFEAQEAEKHGQRRAS